MLWQTPSPTGQVHRSRSTRRAKLRVMERHESTWNENVHDDITRLTPSGAVAWKITTAGYDDGHSPGPRGQRRLRRTAGRAETRSRYRGHPLDPPIGARSLVIDDRTTSTRRARRVPSAHRPRNGEAQPPGQTSWQQGLSDPQADAASTSTLDPAGNPGYSGCGRRTLRWSTGRSRSSTPRPTAPMSWKASIPNGLPAPPYSVHATSRPHSR